MVVSKWNVRGRIWYNRLHQMRLKNKEITLIANDCTGGVILHELGLEFRSPFVNLWMKPSDYIKMLGDLEKYIRMIKEIVNRGICTAKRIYIQMIFRGEAEDRWCVIQPNHPDLGFFGHYINIIGILKKEIENGNKTYIDMGYYPNCYLKPEDLGKVNTWEWYFEQPFSGYEEIAEKNEACKKAKTLFWGLGNNRAYYNNGKEKGIIKLIRNYLIYGQFQRPEDTCDFLTDNTAVAWWQGFAKKYTRFNEKTSEHIDQCYRNLFRSDERVLGVLLRGTDYTDNHPCNCPISPTVEDAIPKIWEVYKSGKYDRIFLATEDERIFEKMMNEFGELVFAVQQKRLGYTNQEFLNNIWAKDSARDPYKMGLDYITAMALLGKCNALMACRTSGAIGALVLAGQYEYTYFWNLGRYITQEYGDFSEN